MFRTDPFFALKTLFIKIATTCLLLFSGAPVVIAQPAEEGEDATEETGLIQTDPDDSEMAAYEHLGLLTDVLLLLRQDYIDGSKVEYRDLIYNGLEGMLSTLDPHSHFLQPSDFERMQDSTRSLTNFGDTGLVVSMKNGTPTVVTALDNTPAAREGILPGDQILKINGKTTENMNLDRVEGLLQGEPGEAVDLTLLRPESKEVYDATLIREVIRIPSVKNARLLPEGMTGGRKIGYVLITQFNSPTAEYLREELTGLEIKGMEALVLDLRNNPGGLLDSAIDVCGLFLEGEEVVVYTEGRRESQRRAYRTGGRDGKTRHYPMVILINGGSASGAEIVAGALKDLDRALLVGETTFGKGSVQSVIQLRDESAVKITTAHYYTPSRQEIHEVGVSPHITATTTAREEHALMLMRNPEELTADQIEDLRDVPDIQLNRAVDALKGLLVFNDRGLDPVEEAQPDADSAEDEAAE
jgi:carboxyl-terminal processing protease